MIQSKHQSPSKLDAVVDSESLDRISGLPDKLLCHILAFLPTRSAVATTVLSKRWNLVWINVPVLDFTELPSSMINSDKADIIFNKEQYISFKDYVNRILLLNGAPCIERVHFEVYEGFARSHLKEWMLVLARRYVQEFFLTSKHLVVELSSSFLLAKEKLVVLNLEGYIELSLPSSVHLPCLQYLSLTNIMFVDEHDPLTSILSGCPVLETLNIDRCKGPEKFSVSSSSVKTLRILSVNHKKEAILIKAPNLEVLHLSIGIKQSVMDDLPSLVEARLDIWTSSVRWIKLLQRICNTKTLVLYRIILDLSGGSVQIHRFNFLFERLFYPGEHPVIVRAACTHQRQYRECSKDSDIVHDSVLSRADMALEPKRNKLLNPAAVDRISKLPRKLLCRILAFLPTRCAVATSILSKKWKYVWTEIPVLDFTDLPSSMISTETVFNREQYVSFRNFINRILLLNRTPCLERVNLESFKGFSYVHFHEWITIISTLFVQELCLTNKHFSITMSLAHFANIEKLVVLNLEGFGLTLPTSLNLACLQRLSLIKVTFPKVDDPLTSLLSSCPVLDELIIDHCKGIEFFSVCSSSVKTLSISAVDYKKKAITLKTPTLEVLHLSIDIMQSLVTDLSSLVEVRLNIRTSSVRWINFLQKFCYTQTLVLYQIILDGSIALYKIPIFENLTHLEVGFTAWSTVLQILRRAPNLASFIIYKLMFDWPDIKLEIKGLPLNKIEYHGFDVDEGFKVIKYFLGNSMLLKELKIYTRRSLDPVTEVDILKTLLMIPRASHQCEITVVNEDYNCQSEDSDTELESDSESEYADSSSDD